MVFIFCGKRVERAVFVLQKYCPYFCDFLGIWFDLVCTLRVLCYCKEWISRSPWIYALLRAFHVWKDRLFRAWKASEKVYSGNCSCWTRHSRCKAWTCSIKQNKNRRKTLSLQYFLWVKRLFVRAGPCFQDGVFRVPKNGMLETNKPLAMRVVGNALAYRKNLQCHNNAGSPTALQAEEVSIWI